MTIDGDRLDSDDHAESVRERMRSARHEWQQALLLALDANWYGAAKRDVSGQLEVVDAVTALLDWVRS